MFTSEPPGTEDTVRATVSNQIDELPPHWRGHPRLRTAIDTAVRSPALSPEEAHREAEQVQRDLVGDEDGGPKWRVVVASAALLVIVLAFAYATGVSADAQPKEVTRSQLKTLSAALITAFTSLLGVVVGIITGEAVSKAEEAT
jgi:hypothetical protein